jgi:3-phosphoglycerate kinase
VREKFSSLKIFALARPRLPKDESERAALRQQSWQNSLTSMSEMALEPFTASMHLSLIFAQLLPHAAGTLVAAEVDVLKKLTV